MKKMHEFKGIYRGFTPTDLGQYGEIEITIDDDSITQKIATKRGIEKEKIPLNEFEKMSLEDVATALESPKLLQTAKGFKRKPGGQRLLFLRHPEKEEEVSLLVLCGVAGIHGRHTLLYNPKQVEQGVLTEKLYWLKEQIGVGVIPRLCNDRRRENT